MSSEFGSSEWSESDRVKDSDEGIHIFPPNWKPTTPEPEDEIIAEDLADVSGRPLAETTHLTPLQRYGAEVWGRVAVAANKQSSTDIKVSIAKTVVSGNEFVSKVAQSTGLSAEDASRWSEAALGFAPDRLPHLFPIHSKDARADVAQSLQALSDATGRTDVRRLNSEVATYVAIARYSFYSRISDADKEVLTSLGTEQDGVDRLTEIRSGLIDLSIDRSSVVADALKDQTPGKSAGLSDLAL